MAIGISLHLGLNEVDSHHYGSALALGGCHNDAQDMTRIAAARGYQTTTLLDRAATAVRLLDELRLASERLSSGDTLLLTYAGHGAQVRDEDADETDGYDETWVLFDRMLLDDELYTAISKFRAGVRILMVSDSCHSGSVARRRADESGQRFRTPAEFDFGNRVWREHGDRYRAVARELPDDPRAAIQSACILLSGCQDDELSADGNENGLFTNKLKEVWGNGRFREGLRAFWQRIRARMPGNQRPAFLALGKARTFERQRPFTIDAEKGSNRIETGAVTSRRYQPDYLGNWAEVSGELERRLPDWKPPAIIQHLVPSSPLAVPAESSLVGVSLVDSALGRAAAGPAIVRPFVWGFHIEISSEGLHSFIGVADPINSIAESIGPVTGPAAPFVAIAAAFVAGALRLLKELDKGNGVYISMSWFAPGIFIPTSVPGNRRRPAQVPSPGRGDSMKSSCPAALGESS